MKIDSFYFNDISEYDDIADYISSTIREKFYGVGKNSISISRLITFLKKSLKIYIKLKYQNDVNIIMTLPSIDKKVVSHDDGNVRIRLSYENISNILNGEYDDFNSYIQEIIDQLETEITSKNKFNFNEYLYKQLNGLIEVAILELKCKFSDEYLKENIVKKESWIKLAQESNIFNDYYMAYMNNSKNKELFFNFLKLLAKKL